MKQQIHYYDTDCGGVVYHSNYLKYMEQARSEYLEQRGMTVRAFMDQGVYFVVSSAQLNYKFPAVYGDIIEVKTKVADFSRVRIDFEYEIYNQNAKLLVTGKTTLVSVDKAGKITMMDKEVLEKLKN